MLTVAPSTKPQTFQCNVSARHFTQFLNSCSHPAADPTSAHEGSCDHPEKMLSLPKAGSHNASVSSTCRHHAAHQANRWMSLAQG